LSAATPYLWAVGASGQNLGAALFYLALFGTPVVLGFGCLTMALSAHTGSVLAALLSTLTLLMLILGWLVFNKTKQRRERRRREWTMPSQTV
jgi:drug/metabolite transporter (DMT)-like permease